MPRTKDGWKPGTPVDYRSSAKRLRSFKSTHGDFELAAARVIARCLGQRIELVDDGSAGALLDGRIVYGDRPPGVFEVVTDTDPVAAATYEEIRERGFKIRTDDLTRHWRAELSHSCDLRRLEAEAPGMLEKLELAGDLFEQHRSPENSGEVDGDVSGTLARLGVTSLFSRPLRVGEAPFLRILPEGTGGFAENDWSGFQRELSKILHAPALADVRAKLGGSGAKERHIFLGLTMSSSWHLNFWLKVDRQPHLPKDPPELPGEATHLWVWGLLPVGRVLAWFPETAGSIQA